MRGLFSGRDWLGMASLPHPHLSEGFIRVTESAICEAWQRLCRKSHGTGAALSAAFEDQITADLYQLLEELRATTPSPVPGFSDAQFAPVGREGNYPDSPNDSIDKQPDLVFKTARVRAGGDPVTNGFDGLFVECKPVDARHPIRSHYCDKGLVKFADGRYAWAMREAMMVAYVFDGSELPDALGKSLSSVNFSNRPVAGPTPCTGLSSRNCCETVHERDFSYPHTGAPAGAIHIRHVWLYFS